MHWNTESPNDTLPKVRLRQDLRVRIAAIEGAVQRSPAAALLSPSRASTLALLILRGVEAYEADAAAVPPPPPLPESNPARAQLAELGQLQAAQRGEG